MKNSNYIINGVLIAAVILLFILHFSSKGSSTKSPEIFSSNSDTTGFHLPIAYIQRDSLFKNYKFAIDLEQVMMKKIEDKSLSVSQRKNKLDRDAAEFQQKVENRSFLTQDRAQQDYDRIIRAQQDLEKYAATIDRELAMEQGQMSKQLQDTLKIALQQFNTPRRYEFILSDLDTDNILYADPSYDITLEVIEFLNARYVPEPK